MNGLKRIRMESKIQLVYLNFTFQLPGQVQLLINVPVYLTFTNVFIPHTRPVIITSNVSVCIFKLARVWPLLMAIL